MPDTQHIMPLLHKTVEDSRRWNMPDVLAEQTPVTLRFINSHAVNTAARQPLFGEVLLNSTYLLRDGIGVKLATKLLNMPETENLNGTDLIPKLLAKYKDKHLAIFGASDAALSACTERLKREGFTSDITTLHGFMDDSAYINAAAQHVPDILILCMGMPRQEYLSATLRANGYEGLIICGGGWADFYSGVKQRAPEWVRRFNLEWLHRLLREPTRLGKRYTVDLAYFFYILYTATRRQPQQQT